MAKFLVKCWVKVPVELELEGDTKEAVIANLVADPRSALASDDPEHHRAEIDVTNVMELTEEAAPEEAAA